MIFCSGALSHLDSFDYKPELIKRHDTPLPGGDDLVTFQGANGNVHQPLYPFRPRGECGKMTSDLLPHIGELSDDLCYIHSLHTKTARCVTGHADHLEATGRQGLRRAAGLLGRAELEAVVQGLGGLLLHHQAHVQLVVVAGRPLVVARGVRPDEAERLLLVHPDPEGPEELVLHRL
ncbi:DUF1501 domain-containing protein, partial [Planctomycetota bacterium]|nr:DUF1501 domain-containing protein [Planctomycetota bacterium]